MKMSDKRNWLKVFERPIKYLKLSGVWFENDFSWVRTVITFIPHIFLVEIYLICSISFLFIVDNLEDFSEAIGILATLFGVWLKTDYFILNKKRFESLLVSLQELIDYESWIEEGTGENLRQKIAQIDRVFKIFMTMAVAGVTFGSFVPFTTHTMPYKMWFPYDYNSNEFVFWLSVFYQLIPGFIYAPTTIIIDTLPSFCISFTTGMINELSERLTNLNDDLKEETKTIGNDSRAKESERLKELYKCIEIQLKIRAFQEDIADIFGKIIWAQGLMSTVILCTTSFSLTIVSK